MNRSTLCAAAAILLLATSCSDALTAPGTLAAAATSSADTITPQRTQDDAATASPPRTAGRTAVTDAPIAAWRSELLDLAFDAASAVPVDPHVKTRSREQERVADACLELGLPRRAFAQARAIADWRRGAVYAAYAAWCGERGFTDEMQASFHLAFDVAENEPTALAQPWRRDRIRARLAQACLWIDDNERAIALQQDLVDSETGAVGAAMARLLPRDQVDAQVDELDALVDNGSLDLARNVLETFVHMFDRFYDDADLRAALQRRVMTAYEKLPLQVRLELGLELADAALAHDDHATAAELADALVGVRDSANWLPEDMVAWMGRLAELRARTGDAAAAQAEIEVALAYYDENRERIVDIWRAGALRPVAEAVAATGDLPAARALYARVLQEGTHNPNSVPRAEDLVETCLSMVDHDVEPDAGLTSRLHAIRDGLGTPW